MSVLCCDDVLCSDTLPGGWVDRLGGIGLFEWEKVWPALKVFTALFEIEPGIPGTGADEIPMGKFPDDEREGWATLEFRDEFAFKGLFGGPFINVCVGADTFIIGGWNLLTGNPIGGCILCMGGILTGGGVPCPFNEAL